MLDQLKDISHRDQSFNTFLLQDVGPYGFLQYDENLWPSAFDGDGLIKNAFEAYQQHWETGNKEKSRREFATDGRALFSKFLNIGNSKKVKELQNDDSVNYLILMEDAYCIFWEGNWQGALEKYRNISNDSRYKNNYAPYFRMGEIYFINQRLVDALNAFDKAESLISPSGKKADAPNLNLNLYRIKVKLANIYWLLGAEFTEKSLSIIREAENLFPRVKGQLNLPTEEEALLNNLLWYEIEQFRKSALQNNNIGSAQKAKAFEAASGYYNKLEKEFLNKDKVASNTLDTAACFKFIEFQLATHKASRQKHLKRALAHCKLMLEKRNRATLKPLASSIQSQHIREIVSEARKMGLEIVPPLDFG